MFAHGAVTTSSQQLVRVSLWLSVAVRNGVCEWDNFSNEDCWLEKGLICPKNSWLLAKIHPNTTGVWGICSTANFMIHSTFCMNFTPLFLSLCPNLGCVHTVKSFHSLSKSWHLRLFDFCFYCVLSQLVCYCSFLLQIAADVRTWKWGWKRTWRTTTTTVCCLSIFNLIDTCLLKILWWSDDIIFEASYPVPSLTLTPLTSPFSHVRFLFAELMQNVSLTWFCLIS